MTTLNEMIDDIVQKKFVSLEAADAISAIKKLAEDQKKEIDARVEQVKTLTTENVTLKARNVALEAIYAAVALREEAVAKREAHMTTLELTAKFEAEKRAVVTDMFGLVFRNLETRRTITSIVPVSQTSGGSSYVTQHTSTETTAEEQK